MLMYYGENYSTLSYSVVFCLFHITSIYILQQSLALFIFILKLMQDTWWGFIFYLFYGTIVFKHQAAVFTEKPMSFFIF